MKDRTMTYFIPALLALLPFGICGETVHIGHGNSLILACLVALGLMLPNKYLRDGMVYISLWMSYIAIGLFLGFMSANVNMMAVIVDGSLWFIIGATVFLIVYYSKIDAKIIYNAICVTALIQIFIGISQSFGYDPIVWLFSQIIVVKSELPATAAVGTLGNNNFLAAFIAISLPFFFRRGWFYAIPIIIAGLFVCRTTTAFVAAIVGTAFYFWPQIREYRKLSIPACIVAVFAGLYYALIYHPIMTNDRPDLWLDGIQKVTKSWRTVLIGFGPTAEWKHGDKLHSEYIMTFYNFGIIGLGLMAGYITSVFKGLKNVDRVLVAAFVVICVDAIGNHLFHIVTTAMLALTIMALIEKQRRESR